jgi:hypothetical protein
MLTQFIHLLSSPEQHVCVHRDGEIYIDAIPNKRLALRERSRVLHRWLRQLNTCQRTSEQRSQAAVSGRYCRKRVLRGGGLRLRRKRIPNPGRCRNLVLGRPTPASARFYPYTIQSVY